MERHKFYVELIQKTGWGTWTSNTQDQFETVIEARNSNEAERMVTAQYGGTDRCRVIYRGRA